MVIRCAAAFLCLWAGMANAQDFSNIGNQKPFGFNGGLEMRGIFYNASGIANRREPFTYLFSGSPTASIYSWSIPFSFTLSRDDRSFRQPFNQFGLSPTYKWLTIHAGYRNVTFSPYTLAGHTMLGGGFELNPGKFRLGFMYGRLNRATVIDTTTQSLAPFSFSRKGLAAKVGYGTASTYLDLHLLHAKDNSDSQPDFPLADEVNVLPAANSVVGYGAKVSLFSKIFLESDGALSVYTNDINSPITFDSIADGTLRRLGGLMDVNGTTEWFYAFSAGVGYKAKYYGLKANYRRVQPDFKSMGAYFFANDVENVTLSPQFALPNGKVRVNASVGIQKDNVNLQKEATNRRIIASGTVGAEFTERLGVDLMYSNFSNNQRPNTLRFADSLKIVQTTQTLSVMPRYTIVGERAMHMVMLSVNISSMNDYNGYFGDTAPSRDISTGQYLVNYSISLPQKRISLFSSLSHTALNSADNKTSYNGVSLGGNYSLESQKMKMGLNSSLMQGDANGNKSLIINGSANMSYVINKLQSIRFSFFLTRNNPGSVVTGLSPAFTESRGELAYQFNFGL
ncbi:hypothetical protein [Olivibacter sitiensis]|uniref:hypothetical protein n=1 Tax=Olivibacter sitiensis TaxID=376470 RepID=UPI00146FA94F|nr:hypothetical protein [Olivibacter sitiensis]